MLTPKIDVAIPSNVLENCTDLRAKTLKIGRIARACVIYNVMNLYIYSIDKKFAKQFINDSKLIKILLEYLDCPQYLRKRVFSKNPSLKYVGLLPPLRTPHHPLEHSMKSLKSGDIREGLVLFSTTSYSDVDVGVEQPLRISVPQLEQNQRIILKIFKKKEMLTGIPIQKSEINSYWGFNVHIFSDPLQNLLSNFFSAAILATSKSGTQCTMQDLELFKHLREKERVLLLFGSPNLGLFQIFQRNGLNLKEATDFILNISPTQGTATIRVEEALISALAQITLLFHL